MKTWTDYPRAAAAMLAVLLTLVACGDAPPAPDAGPVEAPEVAAALDWIEAAGMEFGAAPFSPPGWPYRVGHEIYAQTLRQLDMWFDAVHDMRAVTWVDDVPFGALLNHDDAASDGAIYEGHFPMRTWIGEGGERTSQHRWLLGNADELRARWHEPFEARIYKEDGGR